MVVSHPKNYEFDADEAIEFAEVAYIDRFMFGAFCSPDGIISVSAISKFTA